MMGKTERYESSFKQYQWCLMPRAAIETITEIVRARLK